MREIFSEFPQRIFVETEVYGCPNIMVNKGMEVVTDNYSDEFARKGICDHVGIQTNLLSGPSRVQIRTSGRDLNLTIFLDPDKRFEPGQMPLWLKEIIGALVFVPKGDWRLIQRGGFLVATKVEKANLVYPWSLVLPGERVVGLGLGGGRTRIEPSWLVPTGLEILKKLPEDVVVNPYSVVMGRSLRKLTIYKSEKLR